MTADLRHLSFDLDGLERGYRSGALSPVEVAGEALRRIELANRRLRALTAVFADEALAAARESEARWRRGAPLSAFDGVPVVLKSTLRVAGYQADFGSHMPPPPADAQTESPAVT